MTPHESPSPSSLSSPGHLSIDDVRHEIGRAREAAEAWHRLLPAGAAQSQLKAAFESDMLREKLDYGPRLLCTSLRPHFITARLHCWVEHVLGTITRAMLRIGREAVLSHALQDALGLTDVEKELVAIEPGYVGASILTRVDAFVGEEGLHLVEINGEAPTGVGYNERLFRVFDRIAPMATFARQYPLRSTDGTGRVLDTLLEVYREWGGEGTPRIAIVDWNEVVTKGEFEIFAEHFSQRGVATRIVDPRDLRVQEGRLQAHGEPIDLVYRRVITNEFIERRNECVALEEAYRDRLACFVNSFRSKLLHKKLIFGVLHDPRFRGLLSDEEADLVARHVPLTWAVRPGTLVYQGHDQDLLTFAVAHRPDLVLKPNDDYGGKGLLMGRETDEQEWRVAVDQALSDGADPSRLSVLQWRIPLHQEAFPDLDGRLAPYYVDLDPFFFGEQMFGFLTRTSVRAISNVSAGGSQVPTYILG